MIRKVYLNIADPGACSYYRARLPARHCTEQLAAEGIDLDCSETLDIRHQFDAYVFHRLVNPDFVPVAESLKLMKRKIVVELDDDMWNVPKWNPAYHTFNEAAQRLMNYTLDLADEIWVSTEPLAQVVNRQKKTRVLPNLIDTADYPDRAVRDDGRVRILWAGSIHHDADLDLLAPVVEEIVRRHGDKVEFMFMGSWPEKLTKYVRIQHTNLATGIPRPDLGASLSFVDPVDLKDYPATLCGLAPDIGLCPLTDCKFNESKSCIKALEYTLAGAVTIASDIQPYWNCGATLVSRNAQADEWVRVIDSYIEQPEKRKRDWELAHDYVMKNHTWASPGRKLWLDAFKEIA
jgi:glycosyltransferase involved in cell wall biosynthesis